MMMTQFTTVLLQQRVPAPSRHTRMALGVLVWALWTMWRRWMLLRLRAQVHLARAEARTDPLTGLGNRAALHELLEHPDRDIAMLAIVDLDGFKPVNDQYGHHAGDHVLNVVAHRLRTAMAGHGSAYRLGGDEFALVWHTGPSALVSPSHTDTRTDTRTETRTGAGTDARVHHPHSIAADVLAGAVDLPIRLGEQELPVDASLGLVLNDAHLTGEQMLALADEAMYEAKARIPRKPGDIYTALAAATDQEIAALGTRGDARVSVHAGPAERRRGPRATHTG